MDEEEKVFNSNITRIHLGQKNNLYDLLNTEPAKPIPVKSSEDEPKCLYKPRCDKYYVPKSRSRLKVRTVREIRNLFEQDNYSFIIENMEKQQNSLLNKIRTGSATDDNTKYMAKQLLNADHPISRTAWQMLNNINPEKNVNPTQFVFWNGKRVRVVGSRGGKNKFICNHNLRKNNLKETKIKCVLEKNTKKKRGLLRNSLNIKFKPGPLQRKQNLDDSHQKYQMGPIKLVKLPKAALDIQPSYGTVVEPIMTNFLNKFRMEDDLITEKWAEFALTVLGTYKNNNLVQIDKDHCVTFDLRYKCDQNRILMRRDISNVSTICAKASNPNYALENKSDNTLVIKTTMNKILDSVEISLKQDCMYSIDDESNRTTPDPLEDYNTNNGKEKTKKKYGELDRLAVTVIQLPGTPNTNTPGTCGKSYCNLGCICESLKCTYKLKQHCGYFECMFGCKCEVFKYKDLEMAENGCAELIPGLIKLENEINANLSKEEQKFHQTVVISGEKSILLKSRKRNAKSSKKYAEFYNNMRLKNEQKPKKILTIVDKKLNCSNIEPWCMVHNLYKCFCKGRFTETSAVNMSASLPITNTIVDLDNSNPSDNDISNTGTILRPRVRQSRECSEKRKSICLKETNSSLETCARINEFIGKKYDDSYYKSTNLKILEMEQNDTKLHKKMMKLMKNTLLPSPHITSVIPLNVSDNSEDLIMVNEDTSHDKLETNKNYVDVNKNLFGNTEEPKPKLTEIAKLYRSSTSEDSEVISTAPNIPFEISGDIYKPIKGHLVTQEFLTPWITKSYKNYVEQLNNKKSTLERPKRGSIILHLWECLLSRYRNRRNIFLTTTKRPFRIYIATDISKPFFNNCISIDAIRFADLHKYPCVVKNLLTNATNKDYFCILGGWDDCWEIIGSVKKNDSTSDDSFSNTESLSQDFDFPQENWCVKEEDDTGASDYLEEINSSERSKWFLMKLENDFTEIYCHKKGFYVERDKILHAIKLAQITHKTVVINKPTNTEIINIPFGIYALPVIAEYRVVVGPYEIDESLGLEIVKARRAIKQKSTTGFWITTNKVDNMKVLDDPMSFLPTKPAQDNACSLLNVTAVDSFDISFDTDNIDPSTSQENIIQITQKHDCLNKISKTVKPIKIHRTNGFYHLTSKNRIVRKVLPNTATSLINVKRQEINSQKHLTMNDPKSLYSIKKYSDINILSSEEYNSESPDTCAEPEASQIKITSVYSENEKINNENQKLGMFILKPEEINQKISDCEDKTKHIGDENEMAEDIEHFLSTPGADSASENDVLLISDEDEDDTKKWEDVWIRCSNINNLGWIAARRNKDNLMWIDFPGFPTTYLYTASEAFDKINKALSTRMKIPDNIKLEWQVYKSTEGSKQVTKLLKDLFLKNRLANKFIPKEVLRNDSQRIEDPQNVILNKTSGIIKGLEKTSKLLEDESILLLNKTDQRQSEIIRTLNLPEELKLEMSETLKGLLTMNDDLVDD